MSRPEPMFFVGELVELRAVKEEYNVGKTAVTKIKYTSHRNPFSNKFKRAWLYKVEAHEDTWFLETSLKKLNPNTVSDFKYIKHIWQPNFN